MTKRVLIAEQLQHRGIELLKEKSFEVDAFKALHYDELLERIPDYDALIIRSSTRVDKAVIERGKRLRIIGRAGVGVDNIDLKAASDAGIIVCNAPTSNVTSIAEHTFALLMAAARRIPEANASMKEGLWQRNQFTGVELSGKTLALFGLGRTGALVAKRAQAFGMHLIGYDPYCSQDRAENLGVCLVDNLEEVLARADFITVHLPRTQETLGMFGPEQYAAMKEGVILINAARGGIFNIDSLADFLAAGKIAACGIDVWDEEPCFDSPLHEFDNAILTPHIAASTTEAQMRASEQIAEYVIAGLEGSIVPTAVNLAPVPPELIDIVGPWVPACQMMGSLIAQLSGSIPSKISMTLAGNLAGHDAVILKTGLMEGIINHFANVSVTPVNVDDIASRHGIKFELLSRSYAQEYASIIHVQADTYSLSCTLAGLKQTPRIISLMGYSTELAPAQHGIILEYEDGPGRVGVIGSILGDAGINITTMQIEKDALSPRALLYMNLDKEIPDALFNRLCESLSFIHAWRIHL